MPERNVPELPAGDAAARIRPAQAGPPRPLSRGSDPDRVCKPFP